MCAPAVPREMRVLAREARQFVTRVMAQPEPQACVLCSLGVLNSSMFFVSSDEATCDVRCAVPVAAIRDDRTDVSEYKNDECSSKIIIMGLLHVWKVLPP